MVDWTRIRSVLVAVKPTWEPSRHNEPNLDWDFAQALIEEYARQTLVKCAHCDERADPRAFFRCWDCNAFLCERCIKAHMGPNHTPHPRMIEAWEAEIADLKGRLQRIRDAESARLDDAL